MTSRSIGRRVRVAVIGVGHLGRHHARLLAAMPEADLVAVADRSADRAQAAAGLSGQFLYLPCQTR